ncbi:Fgd5 [Phodopus roborovskii]|uniref:Fgd5 protein n=1 Tax=Phodopus roborovskii TaxID=109678 RepID=A0AAV0A4F2_PHORO|nr:Fgd5 [Phodopus roborovskii]
MKLCSPTHRKSYSPKPPLAPKPKVTTSPSTPAAKFPPSPNPDSCPSPNSMSRGPKPPIAPKPRLAGPSEYGAGVHLNNSLGKCSNGRLLCQDRGIYDGHHSTLNCSELETDAKYILVPRAPLRGDAPIDGDTGEQGFEEEVQERDTEQMGTEGDLAVLDEEAPSRDSEECTGHTLEGEEDCDHGPKTDETPTSPDEGAISRDSEGGEEDCDQGPGMEEQPMSEEEVKEHAYNLVDSGPWDEEEPFRRESVLIHVCSESPEVPCWEPGLPETPGEVEEDNEDGCNSIEPGEPNQDTVQDTEGASGSPENGEVSPDVQEQEVATDSPEVFGEDCEDDAEGGDQVDQDEPPGCDKDAFNRETAAATTKTEEDPEEGGDPVQEDPAEENCQIIPFESDSMEEDFTPTPTESPYELFPTESTSFCNDICSLSEPAKGPEPVCGTCIKEASGTDPSLNQRNSLQDGAGEALPVPDVVVVPEDEDAVNDALNSPYVMGVGLLSLGEGTQSDTQAASGTRSGYSTWEEGDSEGGLVPVDRKNIATRARPHSGKVAGHVPETVLEETGPEACSSAVGTRDTSEEVKKMGMLPEGKPPEAGRALPAKPRAFTLYPRSFSVEGRESPLSMFRESEGAGLDSHRVRRKEDNLSLPGAIGSSGSFSQRSPLPSGGTSTPSSAVDIPPPFDLACITKKPITKSSPSLLIDGDTLDKASKKKKSSFKRLLELTFRKKSENKVHMDMNLSSSRSSSESSYHGPARVLELDRRSLSNSPQLKCRTGKLRASDSPASLIFYRDGKRKGVPFSRTVSRVESFEDRSRPPFLPLPLTKPRSISFPNADTSDYENIPAMNSDYENIQIPPRRPSRAGTFTKLFEEQSRALSTANENDGYVDMSSFNAFESKQQNSEQEAERYLTWPGCTLYHMCFYHSGYPDLSHPPFLLASSVLIINPYLLIYMLSHQGSDWVALNARGRKGRREERRKERKKEERKEGRKERRKGLLGCLGPGLRPEAGTIWARRNGELHGVSLEASLCLLSPAFSLSGSPAYTYYLAIGQLVFYYQPIREMLAELTLDNLCHIESKSSESQDQHPQRRRGALFQPVFVGSRKEESRWRVWREQNRHSSALELADKKLVTGQQHNIKYRVSTCYLGLARQRDKTGWRVSSFAPPCKGCDSCLTILCPQHHVCLHTTMSYDDATSIKCFSFIRVAMVMCHACAARLAKVSLCLHRLVLSRVITVMEGRFTESRAVPIILTLRIILLGIVVVDDTYQALSWASNGSTASLCFTGVPAVLVSLVEHMMYPNTVDSSCLAMLGKSSWIAYYPCLLDLSTWGKNVWLLEYPGAMAFTGYILGLTLQPKKTLYKPTWWEGRNDSPWCSLTSTHVL